MSWQSCSVRLLTREADVQRGLLAPSPRDVALRRLVSITADLDVMLARGQFHDEPFVGARAVPWFSVDANIGAARLNSQRQAAGVRSFGCLYRGAPPPARSPGRRRSPLRSPL